MKHLVRLAVALCGLLTVGGSAAVAQLPCDVYASAGTPCVAAHSTTRALFATYEGSLYEVQRASDNTTLNIGLLAAGGYANAAAQDSFCAGTSCTIVRIYDQSSYHNDLTVEGAGGNGPADTPASATALPVEAGGHKVYGVLIDVTHTGYRIDITKGVAKNGQPEGAYMVTSGTHANQYCCFDYGNAEANNDDNSAGHMDAINFSTSCWFSSNGPCYGNGPWVQADMENGLFQSNEGYSLNSGNTGWPDPFVTAVLKNNGQNEMALRAGNAQSGGLTTEYVGGEPNGYSPMRQEGSIVLGTGGDNSGWGTGAFFEGVMTSGYPADATENSVQANIVSVGYSTSVSTCSTTNPIVPYLSVAGVWSATGETSVTVASGTAVDLGPQPLSRGSWSWTGPNGFTSTAREIDNIALSAGANVYTATYSDSGCTYKEIFTITVSGTPSFTVAPSASTLSVTQGSSATDTISVKDAGGFTGSVTLAASGLPSGVTATFGTNPTTGSSIVTFAASSTATVGTSTVTVKGTSGSLTASTTIVLTVIAKVTTGFTLAPSASSLTVKQGTSGSDTIAVTDIGGFTGSVAFTVSGLPSGVTAAFSPTSSATSSVLTLTASSTATTGAFTVTITGTSGSTTASTSFTLDVTTSVVGSACTVDYTISPQNSSQFGANITIKNGGATTLSNWVLTWAFANGQTVGSSWNGTVAQSGANVTVSEQSGQTWENIPAGGSYAGFGFNGTWNGTTNAIPTAFSLNGTACTVN
jgi:hypothetical protein